MDNIFHSDTSDAEKVFNLFEQSIEYQEKNGYPVWRYYPKDAILKDIAIGNHYKIILDSKIAIAFSVCYTDKIIWRDLDDGKSIYLHRIVANPEFKGQKLFGNILDWSVDHARQRGFSNIRMDTWAVNQNIIEYYKKFGFRFIENYTTPDSEELPVHNRNLALALLEYKIPQLTN
jgi:ribosomal protein S18 acetylase RimI-like enzyme